MLVVVTVITHTGPTKPLPSFFGRRGEEAVVVGCRVAAGHCLGYNDEESMC